MHKTNTNEIKRIISDLMKQKVNLIQLLTKHQIQNVYQYLQKSLIRQQYNPVVKLSYQMSIYRNQYQNVADNTYNSIRSNYGAYQQRSSLKNVPNRPGSYNQIAPQAQNYRHSNSPPRRNSLAKLNDLRKRVHQVIDLCKGQNTEVKGQLNQVISEQKQIYNLLAQNPQLLNRTLSHQSMVQNTQNMQQTIPYRQSQRHEEVITPFRQPKGQNVPQSHYYIPNASQVAGKQNSNYYANISNSNILKPQPVILNQPSTFLPPQQPFLTLGQQDNASLHNSINKLKSTKNLRLDDDALRLIQQIQRKAFEEIEKLRRQKLQLMQRLNLEIRNVNQQRKKNAQLKNLLNRYSSQPQRPDGTSYNAGQNSQILHGQIARLQSQLQRSNELNHNLRLQLSQKGSGVPGIQQLLRQGQAIRMQTLRLLKLKQSGQANQRVEQLERKLAYEVSQKQIAINEINLLKQKLGQNGQSRSYQQFGYQKSSARIKSPQTGKNVGQYQDLVSQMKRITGF